MLVGGGMELPSHGGAAYTWDLDTMRLADSFETPGIVNDFTYMSDGSLFIVPNAYGNGGSVVFWDTRTHRIVKTFHADDSGAWSTDVSNDGHTLVTGGQTSVVRRWDIPSANPSGSPLTGLAGSADTVDLAPRGRRVLGADTDGNVVVWDVAIGTIIGDPFPRPQPGRWAAASFTPDGRHAVVVSDTGSGWLWDVDPTDRKLRACEIVGRSLTRQEWQEFLPDRPYHATCGS